MTSLPGDVGESALSWSRRPGAAALLAAARAKVEAGKTGDRVALVVPLDAAGRDDVARLLGAAWDRSGKPPTLGALRRQLRTHAATDLEALLVAVGGPLRDLRAERETAQASRAEDVARARDLLVDVGVPWEVAADLVPVRVRSALVPDVAKVMASLPDEGRRVGLARLAHDVTGDAHDLDRSEPLGRAVARVLAAAAVPAVEGPMTAAVWRTLWASVGVDCDAVSVTVLVLGVALDGDGPAARLTRAVPGVPVWLTARALEARGWSWPAGVRVCVCENPSVVEAAADAWGASCPPLVCTYGVPSTAAALLLGGLGEGHTVLVSTDRDAAGQRIAAMVREFAPGAQPWLPDVPGVFEESRIDALVADLGSE